ncbi:MAG TPA: hypothetical protein VMM13_12885, partial [Euzebya sp.]|nr:hypothetical protein [Euzebya sp.]
VPWAGRVGQGRFTFEGIAVQLELDAPPHALHGLAYRRPWTVQRTNAAQAELGIDLSTPAMVAAGWPFGGHVGQQIIALSDGVQLTMEVTAGSSRLPLVLGWHPWFLRHLDGVPGRTVFQAAAMLQRGPDGLPTGARVPVPEGPWDDCMVGIHSTPGVEWPGVGRVEVDSNLDHLVIFDGRPDAICVEPQSGPPDAFNHDAPGLAPGASAHAWTSLRWVAAP